jgi:NAD(P)-dependent dehydrogenase (short-subunit alcohol dehydrogenase family)
MKRLKALVDYKNIFSLKKKIIVIFGGAGNLGKSFSKSLVTAGSKVYLLDLKKIGTNNKNIISIKCNVLSKESVVNCFNEIINKEKKIHAVIYNVYAKPKNYYNSLENYDYSTWEEALNINLSGAFLVCQESIKHFKKKKISGNIILISSIYGLVGPDQRIYKNLKKNIYGGNFKLNTPAVYGASKSGLIGLMKHLATTCGKFNIRINCLTPGGVFDNQGDNFHKNYKNRVPLNRMANWTDYNGAIIFLVSDASRYMTGSNLIIDGGWTAW